jgi:DNA-binding XRE family transcriptional regulator
MSEQPIVGRVVFEPKREDLNIFAKKWSNAPYKVKPTTLSEALILMRTERGFTQEQVAELMFTQKSAISRIEKAPEKCRLNTIIEYCKVLNKKMVFVITRDNLEVRL